MNESLHFPKLQPLTASMPLLTMNRLHNNKPDEYDQHHIKVRIIYWLIWTIRFKPLLQNWKGGIHSKLPFSGGIKEGFNVKKLLIWIMKTHNTKWVQINHNLRVRPPSEHIVPFNIKMTVSNHKASLRSWSCLHAVMKHIKTNPETSNCLHQRLSFVSALTFPLPSLSPRITPLVVL